MSFKILRFFQKNHFLTCNFWNSDFLIYFWVKIGENDFAEPNEVDFKIQKIKGLEIRALKYLKALISRPLKFLILKPTSFDSAKSFTSILTS